MSGFTIQTPDLKTAADALKGVLTGVENKTIEISHAKAIASAANGLRSTVSTDLKVRLAAPKLAKIESEPAAA